jgi:hypothetical protein
MGLQGLGGIQRPAPGGGSGSTTTREGLAVTGPERLVPILLALSLLLAGSALFLITRERPEGTT